jgi:hypothetical protein
VKRLRILVAGMVVADPFQGGATWAVLQYALGLRELGHDVELVDPVASPTAAARSYREAAGLACSLGRPRGARFDVLLNLSGRLRPEALPAGIPIRVYVDLDPAFTQLWHLQGEEVGLEGHTHYVTVGARVPATGHDWLSILPPVSLAHWPDAGEAAPRTEAFTTVANWRGYGSIEHGGVHFGQKAHSLRPLARLPHTVSEPLEVALAIHADETADLALLRRHGWRVVDPRAVAGTPDAYRDYVAGSRAEVGIAKSGYVVARSGWFSDRSACYLASGRPVLAQDTGFGERLPTGAGLCSFGGEDEFAAAAERLRADYRRHARAARAIAEEFLDAGRVLRQLLRDVGADAGAGQASLHAARDTELADALAATRIVGRRPSAYRSAAPLLEVEVDAGDGAVRALVVKDVDPSSLTRRALRAKPGFLVDPLREVVVYREVLAGEDLGTPALHAAAVEGRHWLSLERVDGVPLEQVGDLEVWQEAFAWLARLHDRFRTRALPGRLVRYDSRLLLRLGGDRAAASAAVRHAALRLGEAEPTLVHGDLFPANVLVAGPRICVLDWELAGMGPAALDVASLSTGWGPAEQARLLGAYREALAEPPSAGELERDVAFARLVLAARFVSARRRTGWRPPPEHAYDFARDLETVS